MRTDHPGGVKLRRELKFFDIWKICGPRCNNGIPPGYFKVTVFLSAFRFGGVRCCIVGVTHCNISCRNRYSKAIGLQILGHVAPDCKSRAAGRVAWGTGLISARSPAGMTRLGKGPVFN